MFILFLSTVFLITVFVNFILYMSCKKLGEAVVKTHKDRKFVITTVTKHLIVLLNK